MTAEIRMSRQLVGTVQADLRRGHPFAHERVGFLSCRTAALEKGGVLILPVAYHPLTDDEYVESDEAGAMMSENAISKAMQRAYRDRLRNTLANITDYWQALNKLNAAIGLRVLTAQEADKDSLLDDAKAKEADKP